MQNSEKDNKEKYNKNKHSLSPAEDRKGKTYKFVDKQENKGKTLNDLNSTKRMKASHFIDQKQQANKQNRTNSESRIERAVSTGSKMIQSTQGTDSVESATMNMGVTYAGIQAEKFIDRHNSEDKTEQRLKRAAELQQINSELIKLNYAKAELTKEKKDKSEKREATKSEQGTLKNEIREKQIASAKAELQKQKKDIKRENRKDSLEDAIHTGKEIAESAKSADSVSSATMNVMTILTGIEAEKMAQRIKRAKELQELNTERVNLELAKAEFAEKANDNTANDNKNKETEKTDVSNVDDKSEKSQNDKKTQSDEKETTEDVNSEELKELSKDQYKKEQAEKRFNNKKKEQTHESAEKNKLEKKSETIGHSKKSSLSQIYHTGKDIAGGLQSADSVSSATMNVTAVLAEIEAKKLVKNLANKKIDIKSIMARLKNNRNRYGIDKYNEVYDRSAKGQREKKEQKKIEKEENKKVKFEGKRTGNSHKYKEEKKSYAQKQRANNIKTKRQGMFVKENKKLNGGVLSFGEGIKGTAKSYLKKKGAALLLGGSAGLIAPIFLLVLIILIVIMSFFSWLTPHKYKLADGVYEATEEKDVIESYCVMIQDYMTIAQYRYMVSYGDYADRNALYDWKDAEVWATWSGYYELYLKPLIDAAVAEIKTTYTEAIANAAKNQNYNECSRLGQEMAEQIAVKTEELLEQGKKDYDEQIDNLNDMLEEPRKSTPLVEKEIVHFNAEGCSGENKTKLTRTGKDDVNDSGQYSGLQAGGTNGFDTGSLSFNGTDFTPEKILPYIALANSISLTASENGENSEATTPQITEEEINDFFERTKFIQLTVKFEKGCCNGCTRRLLGDWESGWHWEYYCKGDETKGGVDAMKHEILTGGIRFLSEDELLEAVMTEYGAEDVGLSEKECKNLIKEYQKYMEEKIGESSRDLSDKERAVAYYNNAVYLGSAQSSPWSPTTPLTSEEDEENTESNTDETENKANAIT